MGISTASFGFGFSWNWGLNGVQLVSDDLYFARLNIEIDFNNDGMLQSTLEFGFSFPCG